VDIMEEAVEICKLRLFLKLVAQVEKIKDLEPLPDIDFNIRPGNTLVGFARLDDVKATLDGKLGFKKGQVEQISEEAEIVDRAYRRFHEMQTAHEMDAKDFADSKRELRSCLAHLTEQLDRYLATEYGISRNVIQEQNEFEKALQEWRTSHQPFHWFAEFYGIMQNSGFDVILGNPPYLDLKQLEGYAPKNYKTLPTKNLYSLVLERCDALVKARQGYIVPISSTATEGYRELQQILMKRELWSVSFDDRPAHLFDGLDKNTLSILLLSRRQPQQTLASSRLNRWSAEERHSLFPKVQLYTAPNCRLPGCIPRIGSQVEFAIWQKVFKKPGTLVTVYSSSGKASTYYSRKVNAFLQILDFVPEVRDGRGKLRQPSEFKELGFSDLSHAAAVFCLFNSTLFRWFMDVVSDGSHLNRREIDNFPFDPRSATEFAEHFIKLSKRLSEDLKRTSFDRKMTYRHDTLTVQCIVPKFSKPIIDEIDQVLAAHYGFTDEELDFVINYDIKYRMGQDGGEDQKE
jgi:hypothetical protein